MVAIECGKLVLTRKTDYFSWLQLHRLCILLRWKINDWCADDDIDHEF